MPNTSPTPIKNAIEIRNLSFFYGTFKGLKDVNLNIAENKVTAFIGPSGCGKSTLLRTLNRMYSLYPGQRAEGEINLYGTNILDKKTGLEPVACASGHGVPKAHTFPHVHLRQHRFRCSPL